jgi:regulatory protein
MPVVTKLAIQKRGEFVNLYVDSEFCCGISLNQVADWRLYKGQEISLDQLDEIRRQAYENRAYTAAIRYLSFRIRSTGEVQQYLRRKGFEDQSDSVIDRLIREGYLNDGTFTKSWAKMRSEMNWSPRAIRFELMRKGIAKDIVETVIDTDDADRAIQQLVEKKMRRHGYDRDRLMRFLIGRGFSYSQIKTCLDKLDLDS